MPLTLEQRIERIEALLGPPPFAPLHAITLESVRSSTQFIPANIIGGLAIETVEGLGNITTINHRVGNFGDLHVNYAEWNKAESIAQKWTFDTGLNIGGNSTIVFGGDVSLQRGAADVLVLGTGDTVRSGNYTSGYSGWDIASDGTAEFSNVWVRGSIHSAVFVKDLIDARAGTMIIAKSAGKVGQDSHIPTTAGPIYIEPPPGGGWLFEVDDYLRARAETDGGVQEAWYKVTARGTENGWQKYDCTWQSGATGVTWFAGSTVIDYGVSGDGLLLMTAELNYAPYYDVATHAGAPWTTTTLKVRVGNLAGVTDPNMSPTGYGFYSDNAYLNGILVAGGGHVIIGEDGINIYGSGPITANRRVDFFHDDEGTPRRLGSCYAGWAGGANLAVTWLYSRRDSGDPWPVNNEVDILAEDKVNAREARIQVSSAPYIVLSGGSVRVQKGLAVGTSSVSPAQGYARIDHGLVIGSLNYEAGANSVLFYYGSTAVGELRVIDSTWFRINQYVAKNIYTPRMFRSDGGISSGNVTSIAGEVRSTSHMRVGGGLWIGSYGTPDTDCLHIDGSIKQSTALGCRALSVANQSIPSSTWTVLSFDTQIYDTDGGFAPTSTRLYAKHAGYYLAGGAVMWQQSAVGERMLAIKLNGNWLNFYYSEPTDAQGLAMSITTGMFYMAVDHYVEVWVYQNCGGALNSIGNYGSALPNCWLVRIA